MAARGLSFLQSPAAAVLLPASWAYGAAASWNRARLARRQARLPVPVISVGNITCGGTGKTPVVEMLARRLLSLGRRPAILSRGYRAGPDGLNDEARVLARNIPEVPQCPGRDRVQAGREAIARGADALVLDDGFQHVRLARDLDLVLIDALDPFGGGRVLPAGLLREPLAALRHADLIGITRGSLVSPEVRGILGGILRDRFPGVPRVELEMEPVAWEPLGPPLPGSPRTPLPPAALAGRKVAAFAGIGNPPAFRRQIEALGLEVADWIPFPDHARYREADLEEVRSRARDAGAEAVVTTQKDAVKLAGDFAKGGQWWMLRISCRIARGEERLLGAIDAALARAGTAAAGGGG